MPRSRPAIRAFSAAAFPIAFASAVFIAAVGLPSTDSDTYWQLASGRWMLDHGELLRRDVFSATITGAPLGIGEWLGQLVFAAAFAAGGWAGVVVLRSLLVAIAGFFVARLAHRGGIPWWISLPLSVGALLVSRITWTDRPQLFTLALVPALLDLLLTLPGGWSRRLVTRFPVARHMAGRFVAGETPEDARRARPDHLHIGEDADRLGGLLRERTGERHRRHRAHQGERRDADALAMLGKHGDGLVNLLVHAARRVHVRD